MLYLLPLLAHAASAATIPRQTTSSCSFTLTAIGEPNGAIKENTIGQNRIGGTYAQGAYHISNNQLYDSLNHYCGISPTSFQFQCQLASFGSTIFTFADNGNLVHDGSEKWVACPAAGPGDDGSYNIFSDEKALEVGCEVVTINPNGSCFTPASAAIPSTLIKTINTLASPNTTANTTCPQNLNGTSFQFPHLIVPTSPNATDYSFGNSQKAYISPINTTLFNFDIPSTPPYTGTCSLLFLFPYGSDLDPSAGKYYFSGLEEEIGEHGGLDFALLSGVATNATTYANTPTVTTDYGKTQIIPGTNYTIASFPCPAGQTITISGSSRGNVELDYFQNSGIQPIGLYIVPCA